ncbi:helicase [Synechococcus sp. EJ6-Ellesmere]|uniref:helicase n=1 Tax=Synechococcus sp. EJ6-Ellesmere TaxID=2823734 RepID=UPI0020CCC46D|nr:helicase [Synechococcus sp. EJ6-Ellesmere]MCP9824152.1 helicase [Synechococcus sp. EJ6-Ellesmere]
MLEARAHQQLKQLLRQEGGIRWPHHLTMSRLVARSLRRADHTLVRLAPGSDPDWLVGLLVPLALGETPIALVVSDPLRRRLQQVEMPRLKAVGLQLPCWEGSAAPPAESPLWLLSHAELELAWRQGQLGERQLVVPEAERLHQQLRQSLDRPIENSDWERLRRVLPSAEPSLLALHERMSRRIFAHPPTPSGLVPISPEEEAPLRHLLALLGPLPEAWQLWRSAVGPGWTSWSSVDRELLQWRLHRQPLEPLEAMEGLLHNRGAVLVGQFGRNAALAGINPQVSVNLSDPPLSDPLPLYAPLGQPFPNSPHFGTHLLDHCRRLVLGQSGLTIVLVDEHSQRLSLASALAAEFGRRVGHETTAPESNGVICCGWQWWLEHQGRLPLPRQVIVGPLPIASLEDPLTAARVNRLRQAGRDWFRELLLPEAMTRLQLALAGLRRGGGRLAVLDGRLRSRSWGHQVLSALEPWVALNRLLPL